MTATDAFAQKFALAVTRNRELLPSIAELAAVVHGRFSFALAHIIEWRRRNRSRRELLRFSPLQLWDIGLTHDVAEQEARKLPWQQ